MSSVIVDVCRIDTIQPHSNADALEIAHVKGWQCVVRKGEFSAGDAVVYIPPDSVVPVELSDKLGVTKYLSKGRVRCAKLRGEPSFGLVFRPNAGMNIGDNVTDHYGITKYVPPLKVSAGDAEADHPLFVKYTDIENMRNFPAVFNAGEAVVATEKIHGTNCRVGIVEGEWMAGSKEIRRKRPDDDAMPSSTYWYPFTLECVRSLLEALAAKHRQVILFGEVYGKVQSLKYGLPRSIGFAAFDLYLDGRYADYEVMKALCVAHGVVTVPVFAKFQFSLDAVRDVSSGKTMMNGAEHIREGVVVRPLVERHDPTVGRVVLKYLSDEYLFSGEPDREVATV